MRILSKRRYQFGLLSLLVAVSVCAAVFAIVWRPDEFGAVLEATGNNTWTYRLRPTQGRFESSQVTLIVRTKKVRQVMAGESPVVGGEYVGPQDADTSVTCLSINGASATSELECLFRLHAPAVATTGPVRVECAIGKSVGVYTVLGTSVDGTVTGGQEPWKNNEIHLLQIWTREGNIQYVHDVVAVRR